MRASQDSTKTRQRSAHRRKDADLCVPRSSWLEPIGSDREKFYEQRLLFGLPWHCRSQPTYVTSDGRQALKWTFCTDAPAVPDELMSFSMTERVI